MNFYFFLLFPKNLLFLPKKLLFPKIFFFSFRNGLLLLRSVYSCNDLVVGVFDHAEVARQAQAETPHAEVEEQSEGHDGCRRDVHPFVVERSGVSLHREHRVTVEKSNELAVFRVGKVFYYLLQAVVYPFDLVVWSGARFRRW